APVRKHAQRVHLEPPVEEAELQARVAGESARGRVGLRDEAPVGVTRGVEALGQVSVGVAPLSLGRIVPQPPRGNGERGGQKQESGEEPDPAGPGDYFPPPWLPEAPCSTA